MSTTQLSFSKLFFTTLSLGVVLLLPGNVHGYFYDDNNSADNGSFSTGAVEAALTPTVSESDLSTLTSTSLILTPDDTSTVDTQSRLTFTPQTCQFDFYTNVLLEVTTASGTSVGTFADVVIQETGVPSTYTLDVVASLDLVSAANESCVILATLETWQTAFDEPTAGFSSVSQATITLTTPDAIGALAPLLVVLNEIYPAILSTTTVPLEREWIELYNGTAAAVDVAGWRIDEFVGGDSTAGSRPHTIVSTCTGVTTSNHMQPFGTADTLIPAGGFLVVEFCGSAPYLSDGGDTVQLFNASAILLDAHTYPATANGKSHARIPDGAAWVDPIPTPGNKNTATRADLEAEGWDEQTIDATLVKLAADDTASSHEVSTTPGAASTQPGATAAPSTLGASVGTTSATSTKTIVTPSVLMSSDTGSTTVTASTTEPSAAATTPSKAPVGTTGDATTTTATATTPVMLDPETTQTTPNQSDVPLDSSDGGVDGTTNVAAAITVVDGGAGNNPSEKATKEAASAVKNEQATPPADNGDTSDANNQPIS